MGWEACTDVIGLRRMRSFSKGEILEFDAQKTEEVCAEFRQEDRPSFKMIEEELAKEIEKIKWKFKKITGRGKLVYITRKEFFPRPAYAEKKNLNFGLCFGSSVQYCKPMP